MKQHESVVGSGDEAGDVRAGRCIAVYDLQPHVGCQPLHLLDDIEGGMDDELIHVARGLAVPETRHSIATSLGSTECQLE